MFSVGEDVEADALFKRGGSIAAIARHLERDPKTIRSYLKGERVAGGDSLGLIWARRGGGSTVRRANRGRRRAPSTPSTEGPARHRLRHQQDDQGNVGHVFSRAGFGPLASRASESSFAIISFWGLDIHGLAVHNGGSRSQRLPGCRSDSLRSWNATEIIATGFARGRTGAPLGKRIVSTNPRTVFDPRKMIFHGFA